MKIRIDYEKNQVIQMSNGTELAEQEWEVESIIGERKIKKEKNKSLKKTEYLIKWVGYDQPTWEPIENLDNCKKLLNEYLKKQKTKTKKNRKILVDDIMQREILNKDDSYQKGNNNNYDDKINNDQNKKDENYLSTRKIFKIIHMNKPKNKDIINQSKSITKNKKNTKKNGNKTEKKIVSEDNNNSPKQCQSFVSSTAISNSNEVEKNNFPFNKFCSLNSHQYNLDNSEPYKEETENDFNSLDSGNAMSKGFMSFDSYYNNSNNLLENTEIKDETNEEIINEKKEDLIKSEIIDNDYFKIYQ